MDLAESRFIWKVVIKEWVAEVLRKIGPFLILWELFKVLERLLCFLIGNLEIKLEWEMKSHCALVRGRVINEMNFRTAYKLVFWKKRVSGKAGLYTSFSSPILLVFLLSFAPSVSPPEKNPPNRISALKKKTKCFENLVLGRKPNKCATGIAKSKRLGFWLSSVNSPSGFFMTCWSARLCPPISLYAESYIAFLNILMTAKSFPTICKFSGQEDGVWACTCSRHLESHGGAR